MGVTLDTMVISAGRDLGNNKNTGVPPGYKQSEVGLIPQEWEYTFVGAMISDGTIEKPLDGNHGNIHPASGDFVDWGIPFVMANNVQRGRVDLVNCAFIRREQADSLQKGFSKTGDVLLTHKATIGNTAIVGETTFPYIMLTPQVTYYRVKNQTRLSNLYLRYFFDSAGFQRVLKALAGGGTRAYIGISAQHQLPIVLPPTLQEQNAIAEALSGVDELIVALEALIAKKRAIKQAAMQQLLTGKTRLPGFTANWATKRIGQFADCISGGTPSTLIAAYWGGPIRWMSSGELNQRVISEVEGRITEYGLRESSTKLIPFGSVLVGLAGQGKTRGTVGINLVELCTNQSIAAILPNESFVSQYLYHNLDSRYEEIRSMSSGQGGRGGLNLEIIRSISVPFPHIEEQLAIAVVLSDMDLEIAALETRRNKTRAIKQGMMQQLLTGRIRLVKPQRAEAQA